MVNPDRVAFSLFGRDIYWYGVLMALGILIAVQFATVLGKRRGFPKDTVLDLILVIIPCGLVGARLYYVLFEFEHYLSDPIRILYVWEGGLAIYGAVIGGLLGAIVYSKCKGFHWLNTMDLIAPGLVLAQAIGRWGNFCNQEAFGLPVTNPDLLWFPLTVRIDVPWNNGIHYFNGELCENPYHLATFFYESMWCLLIFLFLWFVLRKRAKHVGDLFLSYAMLYGFERMFVEGLRGDSLWLIEGSVRVSQALSFVLFVGLLAFFLVRHAKEKKLEGVLLWPGPIPAVPGKAGAAVAEASKEGEEIPEVDAPSETPECAEEESDDPAEAGEAPSSKEPEAAPNAEAAAEPDPEPDHDQA